MTNQFELLWSLLPHPSPSHVVRLFARTGDRRIGDFARSPREIEAFVKSAEGMNVYVAPNPTVCCTGIRHSARDVDHWSFIFLDVDPVEETYDADLALEVFLDRFSEWVGKDLLLNKPIIVDSGRGRQAWIRLPDYKLVDDAAAEGHDADSRLYSHFIARKTMSFWLKRLSDYVGTVHGCRLDTTVSDLPRVMRLPGTVNQKTGRISQFLHTRVEPYLGMGELLIQGVPESVYLEPAQDSLPRGASWQTAFPMLTRKAQDYLTKGKEEPGRHEAAWHTAKKLCEVGVSAEQTLSALSYANKLRGEDHALPLVDLEHAVKTAYGRA